MQKHLTAFLKALVWQIKHLNLNYKGVNHEKPKRKSYAFINGTYSFNI